MRVLGLDLFDPRALSMQPDYTSSPPGDSGEPDFGFAFNDRNFSDRILRIEVVAGTSEERSESEAWAIPAGWAARRSKRRRGYINKREKALDINKCPEEQILYPIPDPDHGLENENHDEDKILMIEDCPSGDETVDSDDSNCSEDGSKVLRVETLHISSLILAAKSPFFYKLFSNGTVESEPRHVSLRINASEEAALMELLNFMYTSILTSNSSTALLAVLMAADKFEVASCMRHCCQLLKDLPMTPESALWYLDLPSKVLMAGAVQHLTDAAKQFLAARYKDISKYPNEVMKLPLAGIEAVLSSSDLQVPSEDAVYDFALKWTRTHYQSQGERRDILSAHLGRHIRFSYLTTRKLRKLLSCPDFDHDFATKAVLDALFFKAECPNHQRSHHASEANSTDHHYEERDYKYRPIKVVEFELPRQQCVVYLDLKREECANLFPSSRVYSQAFHLGGQGFFLSAHCNMDQQCSSHCFGLFLGMQDKGAMSFGVDYEFSVRTNTSEEFVSKYKGNYTFTGGKAVGYRNLFGIPWLSFMAEDSNYFMYDILHLRAELTVKKEAI